MDYGNRFNYYLNDQDPYLHQVYNFLRTSKYSAGGIFDAVYKYKEKFSNAEALNRLKDDCDLMMVKRILMSSKTLLVKPCQ